MEKKEKKVKNNLYLVSLICSLIASILCIFGIIMETITKGYDYMLWILLLICNVAIFVGDIFNRKNLK